MLFEFYGALFGVTKKTTTFNLDFGVMKRFYSYKFQDYHVYCVTLDTPLDYGAEILHRSSQKLPLISVSATEFPVFSFNIQELPGELFCNPQQLSLHYSSLN